MDELGGERFARTCVRADRKVVPLALGMEQVPPAFFVYGYTAGYLRRPRTALMVEQVPPFYFFGNRGTSSTYWYELIVS